MWDSRHRLSAERSSALERDTNGKGAAGSYQAQQIRSRHDRFVSGHGFSRAVRGRKKNAALAR